MNRTRAPAWHVGVSMIALGVATAGAAVAAEDASPSKPAMTTVGELIVTATRRSESLQKVPQSITSVTGAQIKEQGISNYEDLVRTVPGVIATGEQGLDKITIRGIETSQTTSSIGAQRAVAIYVDDLPVTSFSVITPDINPYDMSRVEVLRGPQGTLFGSGSLAGALRYITNKPDPAAYHAAVDVDGAITGGGSYRRGIDAMMNIPIVQDQLALRLVGSYRNDDGWVTNIGTGQKNANSQKDADFRAALLWRPTDKFTATLTANYESNRTGDESFYDPSLGLNVLRSDVPFYQPIKMKTANILLDYDFGWANLTSSTSVADVADSWNLELDAVIPGIPLNLREVLDTKTFEQEVRLASKNSGRLDWVVGAYFLEQNSDEQDVLFMPTSYVQSLNITGLPTNVAPGSAYSNDLEKKKNLEAAIFGESNYKITDTIKITVGVRIGETEFTDRITGKGYTAPAIYTALFTGGNTALTLAPQAAGTYSTGLNVNIAPRFSLSWQPTHDQTFYFTASEGFRRGQPNGVEALNNGKSLVNPNDPAIIPVFAAGDSLWNFELGAKTIWLDGRLRANLAAYYIDWTDMQVPLQRSSDASIYVGNIGQARSVGLEGEFQARPIENLETGLNFTVQDARVTSITPAQALISGAVNGSPLASPRFKIGAFAKYDWSLGEAGLLYARFDFQYLGSYPNGFPNAPGLGTPIATYATVPGYADVNISGGWKRKNVGTTIYVDNLFDNHSPIFINPANFSANRYETLRPRTVGVRLSWKY